MPKDSPVHELFLGALKFSNIIYGAPPFNFPEGTQNGGEIKHREVISPHQ